MNKQTPSPSAAKCTSTCVNTPTQKFIPNNHSTPVKYQMQTKLGKLLCKVLPNDGDVKNIDRIRKNIKTKGTCGKSEITTYKILIAKLEVKLSKVRGECTEELQEIEKKKFTTSNFRATSLKIIQNDPVMVKLYNKIKVIDAIKSNLNL